MDFFGNYFLNLLFTLLYNSRFSCISNILWQLAILEGLKKLLCNSGPKTRELITHLVCDSP